MSTTATAKQSQTEQDFWAKIHSFRQLGVCGEVTREDATQFFGSKVNAEAYARHDIRGTAQLLYTLQRSGGLNKRTTVKCYAAVNGERCSEARAIGRLHWILESSK